jgi:hypothetical protein
MNNLPMPKNQRLVFIGDRAVFVPLFPHVKRVSPTILLRGLEDNDKRMQRLFCIDEEYPCPRVAEPENPKE